MPRSWVYRSGHSTQGHHQLDPKSSRLLITRDPAQNKARPPSSLPLRPESTGSDGASPCGSLLLPGTVSLPWLMLWGNSWTGEQVYSIKPHSFLVFCSLKPRIISYRLSWCVYIGTSHRNTETHICVIFMCNTHVCNTYVYVSVCTHKCVCICNVNLVFHNHHRCWQALFIMCQLPLWGPRPTRGYVMTPLK